MRNLYRSIKTIARVGLLTLLLTIFPLGHLAAQDPFEFTENFDNFDPSRFQTKIPNKNTRIRNGVLWTHGESGGKYPPMVHLDLSALEIKGEKHEYKDLEISFRYRYLQPGSMIWFFLDGDDGYGSVDHLLRVKLLPTGVQLQIDSHTLDANHPDRQNKDRPADKISAAFRLSQKLPKVLVELKTSQWHDVKVVFRSNTAAISVDDDAYSQTLRHNCFNTTKRKMLWMQKSGDEGIEIDDVVIRNTTK